MNYILSFLIFIMASLEFASSYTNVPVVRQYRPSSMVMSLSHNYLNNLQKLPLKHDLVQFNNMVSNASICNESEVKVDTMYFNINRVNSLFFNPKSKNIMFLLDRELSDLYYYDNNTMYKLTDKTKIISSTARNFVITDLNILADGFLCK